MNSVDITQNKTTSKAIANSTDTTQLNNNGFEDNRAEATMQRKLQNIVAGSAGDNGAVQLKPFDNRNSSTPIQKMDLDEEEGKMQFKKAPIQKVENNTGLPDRLKSGVENLSGVDISDVKVHYNSDKPAQLNAHAYAQGTDIHVASGQEKHLPHEAWHVVQQKQGRVKPTMQLREKVNINDDVGLEKEADVMGARALQMKATVSPLKDDSVRVIANPIANKNVQKYTNRDVQATSTTQLFAIRKVTAENERHIGSVANSNSDASVQMVRVEPLGDIGISLADIVASMNTRAVGATSSMLEDFAELHEDYIYYVAWNEEEGADARYGIMSLKGAPAPLDGEADDGIIAGSLWVEGLVADAGGGFGGLLLAKAEELAQANGSTAVALAAYEYDMDDQDDLEIHQPYSVASYYEHKGYVFSGEGYVEVDNGREYFYPIYLKQTVVL